MFNFFILYFNNFVYIYLSSTQIQFFFFLNLKCCDSKILSFAFLLSFFFTQTNVRLFIYI